MRYLVLAIKLIGVPIGLALLIAGVARDPHVACLHVDPWPLAAALAVNQVALALFAVRMRIVLGVFGLAIGTLQALRVHLQSMFYYFALPMTVGLEIARFAKVKSLLGEGAPSAALTHALLVDRFLGAAAALALAAVLLPFVRFGALMTWTGAGSWWPWVALALAMLAPLALHRRVRMHVIGLAEVVRAGRGGLAASFAVGLATHACFALGIHLAARSAGVDVDVAATLFAISAGMLFVVVPVSFAGVSPAEAANFGVLLGLGLPLEQAAVFAFIAYLAKLVAALQGAAWEIAEGGDLARGRLRAGPG